MIYRKQIRTVKNTTETTLSTSTISSSSLSFALTTTDEFYVGFHRKFTTRYFQLGTVNSNTVTVAVEYWDGDQWSAVEDLVDQTLGFTQSGFISWINATDWKEGTVSPVLDTRLYWVRITVSGNLSGGTTLQSVNNLFCDATMLRAYYPELVSDSRYLPPDRTNFLEQFQAAKDLTVLRLKQKKAIRDEADILDITEVATAATHAAAYLILQPIARSESDKELAKEMYDSFQREIDRTTFSFDLDESGTITEVEEDIPVTFRPRW